jgi:Ca2+-binding EF-hand superfamily protein
MKNLLLLASIAIVSATSVYADNLSKHDKVEYMKTMTEHYFKKVDANGDGFITRDEQMAFAAKMFDEADTNHDGKLSMDEVLAQKNKEMTEMKQDMGDRNMANPRTDDDKH